MTIKLILAKNDRKENNYCNKVFTPIHLAYYVQFLAQRKLHNERNIDCPLMNISILSEERQLLWSGSHYLSWSLVAKDIHFCCRMRRIAVTVVII